MLVVSLKCSQVQLAGYKLVPVDLSDYVVFSVLGRNAGNLQPASARVCCEHGAW